MKSKPEHMSFFPFFKQFTDESSSVAFYLDGAQDIFGFKGKFGLAQLALGQKDVLNRIDEDICPHDVLCPILPFPSTYSRTSDERLKHFDGASTD